MATTEVANQSPGVWGTITQYTSDIGTWFSETATAVGDCVAPYFNACLTHVEDNKEAYTWGAVCVAVGAALTALFAYIFCGSEEATEKGSAELSASAMKKAKTHEDAAAAHVSGGGGGGGGGDGDGGGGTSVHASDSSLR